MSPDTVTMGKSLPPGPVFSYTSGVNKIYLKGSVRMKGNKAAQGFDTVLETMRQELKKAVSLLLQPQERAAEGNGSSFSVQRVHLSTQEEWRSAKSSLSPKGQS